MLKKILCVVIAVMMLVALSACTDSDLLKRVEELESTVGQQSSKITELEGKNKEQSDKISELEDKNKEQSDKISELEDKNKEQSDTITELEERVKEYNEYYGEHLPELVLDDTIKSRIEQDLIREYGEGGFDFRTMTYYGNYDGYEVFFVFCISGRYNFRIILGENVFRYVGGSIVVWKEEFCKSIEYAYAYEILSDDDIKTIGLYHAETTRKLWLKGYGSPWSKILNNEEFNYWYYCANESEIIVEKGEDLW